MPTLEGCTDDLDLKNLVCNHCKHTGSLISEWPEEGGPCPGCGNRFSEPVSCWIT